MRTIFQKVDIFCKHELELIGNLSTKRVYLSGLQSIILDPELTSIFFHESVGHYCEADSKSNLNNIQRGTKVSLLKLNVKDRSLPNNRGYALFDDEGVKCKDQILIKNGLIKGRMNSRTTGYLFNEEPCGNARSLNYSFPPLCRMRHLEVENGDTDKTDVIKSLKRGVIAYQNGGGYSGLNFSLIAKYVRLIEDGTPTHVIRNAYIYGNIFESLKHITAICNDKTSINQFGGCGKEDQYPLPVSFSSPSVFLSNGINIG